MIQIGKFLRRLMGGLQPAAKQPLQARYEAAQTTDQLSKWWAGADSAGPNWANRYSERKRLRERSRYEVVNNSYACGLVRTIANHTVGTGPRLQLTGAVREWNSTIEAAWAEHSEAIGLTEKLTTMCQCRVHDGESFGVMFFNDRLPTPAKIDVRLVETDQVHDPREPFFDPYYVDGIQFDKAWNPESYRMLKHHPGEGRYASSWDLDTYSASIVLHYFRSERPGQARGVPDLTPSLELFAILRRFTRATLAASEAAALFAAFIRTTGTVPNPAEMPADWLSLNIDYGTLTTLPEGWDVSQLKPEHPSTTYPQFTDKILQEIGRCLSVPFNILTCNSSGYNFSSGRLDHQLYYRSIYAEQKRLERVVMSRLLRAWFLEWIQSPSAPRGIPLSYIRDSQWFWDPPEAIDPQAEDAARETRLRTGMSTLPIEYARLGLDWEVAQEQAANSLGLTVQDYRQRLATSLLGPASQSPQGVSQIVGPDGQPTQADAGGEFGSVSRLQWSRNVKAIRDVLADFISGKSSRVMAEQLLRSLGLSGARAEALLNDALDGTVDDPAVNAAATVAASCKQLLLIPCATSGGLKVLAAAGKPLDFRLQAKVNLAAEAGTAGQPGRDRRFNITAYTGGKLPVNNYDLPVVVDYQGLTPESQVIPILADHNNELDSIIGQSDSITLQGNDLIVSGLVMNDGEKPARIIALADKGFQWKASIGAITSDEERIPSGTTVEVNGQTFVGPIIVARRATLREVSFVAMGADPLASAQIAANARLRGAAMPTFEEWCTSQGFDPATLSDQQKQALMVAYNAQSAQQTTPPVAAGATPTADQQQKPADGQMGAAAVVNLQAQADKSIERHIQSLRQREAVETTRLDGIRTLCASLDIDDRSQIQASAINDGWTLEKTELAVLKAKAKKGAPAGKSSDAPPKDQVLEAALCLKSKIGGTEKAYAEPILEAADKLNRDGFGLQQLLLMAAAQNGEHFRTITQTNLKNVLRAAFSTGSIPGILSNVANKSLLDGYKGIEEVWRMVSAIRSVKDFKEAKSYRLTTSGRLLKLGPGGQIKHATYGEESYSVQAETYARMLQIPREHIINDDLGALSSLPNELGRKGAQAFNLAFWTEFLDDAAFFATGNANIVSGTANVLGSIGLNEAWVKFMGQTDNDGAPLGIDPSLLLVPKELATTAMELYASEFVNTGGAATKEKVPNRNIWQGKYKPIVSRYLSNTSITGYSTTGYYLLADPADMAVMQVAFLDGNEMPVLEQADADFDQLGIQMRVVFDFGVKKMQPKGGVKVTGVA